MIQKIDKTNRDRVNAFIIQHWFTLQMAVHGESIDLGTAEGFFACEGDEIIGLITYRLRQNELEILSLDSIREKNGIGTALLNEVLKKARETGVMRVFLITTNDNLNALRFYQKRGFDMIRLYHNAVVRARKIKPEIPLTGMQGISLKHEIELEIVL